MSVLILIFLNSSPPSPSPSARPSQVNVINIQNIIPELIAENIVRGRGLLARSVMKAQTASPIFTHVYAALVAVVNTKVREGGEEKNVVKRKGDGVRWVWKED